MPAFCSSILILPPWSPVVSCCPSKVNYLTLFTSVIVDLSLLMWSWQQNPFTGAFRFLLFVLVNCTEWDQWSWCSDEVWLFLLTCIYANLPQTFCWEIISCSVYSFWKSFVQTLTSYIFIYRMVRDFVAQTEGAGVASTASEEKLLEIMMNRWISLPKGHRGLISVSADS